MQTKLTGLHLFAGKLSLFALHFVGGGALLRPRVLISSEQRAEQSPAPTERIPKAPLAGADSPYQGEMSRRDKRGRDAVCEADWEVVTNPAQPLRLGFAEPPPLGGEALDCTFPASGKAFFFPTEKFV